MWWITRFKAFENIPFTNIKRPISIEFLSYVDIAKVSPKLRMHLELIQIK